MRPYCFFVAFLIIWSCSKGEKTGVSEIKRFSLDSIDGVITQTGVEVDKEVKAEGEASLHIRAENPMEVRLFEVESPGVDNARITYQAKLRTKDLQGQAYLEMWCAFTGKGEFFSRGLQNTITGTNEWMTAETPFFLKKGEMPDRIKLNLIINGRGDVWIDDIRLIKGPLQ